MIIKISAVLFDLDGTLLDTAADFLPALNRLVAAQGKSAVQETELRKHLHATEAMMACAFGKNYPNMSALTEQFLKDYFENCTQNTTYFPGAEALLSHLEIREIPWGIVTNKSQFLAKRVVQHFQLDKKTPCIIAAENPTQKKKPDPEPLWRACKILGVKPEETVYVGDMPTDILAAKNARMKSIAVPGYYPQHPAEWEHRADHVVKHLGELIDWLQQRGVGKAPSAHARGQSR